VTSRDDGEGRDDFATNSGCRSRPPHLRWPERIAEAVPAAPQTTTTKGLRSWGERHGATVFIVGVFVLLALLVVVKNLGV
jgi:hypothetical protein